MSLELARCLLGQSFWKMKEHTCWLVHLICQHFELQAWREHIVRRSGSKLHLAELDLLTGWTCSSSLQRESRLSSCLQMASYDEFPDWNIVEAVLWWRRYRDWEPSWWVSMMKMILKIFYNSLKDLQLSNVEVKLVKILLIVCHFIPLKALINLCLIKWCFN